MILTISKFAIIPSHFDAFKDNCYINDASSFTLYYVTNVTYLTPHKGSKVLKARNFLTRRQPWCH